MRKPTAPTLSAVPDPPAIIASFHGGTLHPRQYHYRLLRISPTETRLEVSISYADDTYTVVGKGEHVKARKVADAMLEMSLTDDDIQLQQLEQDQQSSSEQISPIESVG